MKGREIPSRWPCTCKGPEAGMSLALSPHWGAVRLERQGGVTPCSLETGERMYLILSAEGAMEGVKARE